MQIIHDFRLMVGVEPADFGIALKPSHLLAGVDTRILLDFLHGKVECPFAVEVLEQLLVSHSVERIVIFVRIDAAHFVQQSVGHHLIHPAVNTVVKFLPVTRQANLDNAERPGLRLPGAEGGVGLAGHITDFEGMDDALGILQVDNAVVFGVEQAQLGTQAVEALRLVLTQHQGARFGIDRGDVVNTLAHGVDVHHGTTREQHHLVLRPEGVEQLQYIGFVLGGAIIVGQLQRAHKVMLHPTQLFGCGRCCAYLEVGIELPRVGRDNAGAEPFSQSQAQFGFAYAGGADEYKKSQGKMSDE